MTRTIVSFWYRNWSRIGERTSISIYLNVSSRINPSSCLTLAWLVIQEENRRSHCGPTPAFVPKTHRRMVLLYYYLVRVIFISL